MSTLKSVVLVFDDQAIEMNLLPEFKQIDIVAEPIKMHVDDVIGDIPTGVVRRYIVMTMPFDTYEIIKEAENGRLLPN